MSRPAEARAAKNLANKKLGIRWISFTLIGHLFDKKL